MLKTIVILQTLFNGSYVQGKILPTLIITILLCGMQDHLPLNGKNRENLLVMVEILYMIGKG